MILAAGIVGLTFEIKNCVIYALIIIKTGEAERNPADPASACEKTDEFLSDSGTTQKQHKNPRISLLTREIILSYNQKSRLVRNNNEKIKIL